MEVLASALKLKRSVIRQILFFHQGNRQQAGTGWKGTHDLLYHIYFMPCKKFWRVHSRLPVEKSFLTDKLSHRALHLDLCTCIYLAVEASTLKVMVVRFLKRDLTMIGLAGLTVR